MRDRSIKASLAASTLTPAITAPELSFARPEIVLCADAAGARREKSKPPKTHTADLIQVMGHPVSWSGSISQCLVGVNGQPQSVSASIFEARALLQML